MKKFRTTMITLFLIFAVTSSALANGLSLNSVGPRALGMGGAFVGLANDGSAIYWNPAGLAGQESAVMGYFTGVMPLATYKNDMNPSNVIDASANSKLYPTGGLFVNYKMDKWAFGLGVFVPAGLGVEWNAEDLYGSGAASTELMSEIGAVSISPAIAYQITEQFSLGVTVNIYYGMFDMAQPVLSPFGADQFTESSTGTGVGFTIGAKYDFSEQFSAGVTFKTSTKVSMSGDATNTLFPKMPNNPPTMMPGPETSSFSRDVTWPMWIAGGIAYKPTCGLTITFDAQYSQWSELEKLVAEYDDPYWKMVMEGGGDNEFHLNWEDAIQIRLGGEYLVSKVSAVRLGYYYDPAPAPDETVNILFPSSTNHVITAGYGYNGEKIFVDFGIEYLLGAERDIPFDPTDPTKYEMPGKHKMDVFAFGIGIGYRF